MFDVIVIGGSYAGMSAALQIARARRRVLVVDAGRRRNRFAAHAHGFLGQDGRAPGEIAAIARAEVLAYPTVTWLEGAATTARATADGFAVRVGADEHLGKRLVLASGVVDELPDVPGVAERWGKTIAHCPYCHGYELDAGAIGVLATSPLSMHQALLVPDWSAPGATTFFLNGAFEPDAEQLRALAARGVVVERAPVVSMSGDDRLVVHLGDGRSITLAGLFLAPRTRIADPLPAALGCELEAGPMGPFLKVDAMMKETTVPGVFACGDIAVGAGTIATAVGDGVRAGAAAHMSILFR